MMVGTSRRPRRSNQWVSNEEVYILVLVLCLLPFFRWFLYLFSMSCVVELLLRLLDMLVLILVLLVLLFSFDLACCITTQIVGCARSLSHHPSGLKAQCSVSNVHSNSNSPWKVENSSPPWPVASHHH
jgi:hypothetical protein